MITIVTIMDTKPDNTHLASSLFGKTRRAVLALLFRHTDESFYLRQIVRQTGAGLGPVQRELKNLMGAGIITRKVQGNQIYYRANGQCPIFNELKSIIRKTFGVADIIRQSLAPLESEIVLAFIYGSIASNADDRKSDLDLLIVSDMDEIQLHKVLMQAEEELGRPVNYHLLTRTEYHKRRTEKDGFLARVLAGPKIILTGSLDEL